jgi:hypothetical protein
MASTSFKVAFYAKLSFLFAGFFTASSLLAFYYRLIQESGVRWFRIALHCSVAFNIFAWLPFVFTEIFVCMYVNTSSYIFSPVLPTHGRDIVNADKHLIRPIYAYWTFPEPAGSKCMLEGPVTMVGGLVKIVVDLLITTLPIPLILRMNMGRRQRYLVVLLLGLGYIVTAAGAVRAYFTWKAFYDTNDQTWYEYPAFVAAALENNLAIVCRTNLAPYFRAKKRKQICACIPTIRPLVPHLFGGPVSRIKNWISTKASSYQNSTIDMSGSHGSRLSPNRSKLGSNSINKLAISAPMNSAHSRSSDTKLVIRQTDSFELTVKSIYDEGPRSGSARMPDYYHFGPRYDERAGFHAV